MRDRAIELLDEEAALGSALADVGRRGRDGERSPASTPIRTGCSSTGRRVRPVARRPSRRTRRSSPASGSTRSSATPRGSCRPATRCGPTATGRARRRRRGLGGAPPRRARRQGRRHDPGRRRASSRAVVVAPLDRGVVLPAAGLAVVAETDLTGRRRAHRRPRRAVTGPSFFEDLEPGDYVVHYQHGVGRYEGMVKRTIGGVERDYLLLEYKAGDRLYVPSDQVDVRAPVRRRRDADAEPHGRQRLREGQEPGSGRRCARSPRSSSSSTRSGLVHARPRLRTRHAVAARDGGGLPVRRDARPARRPSTT